LRSDLGLSLLWLRTAAAAGLIKDPVSKAVKLQWWAACVELLEDMAQDGQMWAALWHCAVDHAAEAGQAQVIQQLLDKWERHRPQEDPWAGDMYEIDHDRYLMDLRYSE
jgi:hypothetical protein